MPLTKVPHAEREYCEARTRARTQDLSVVYATYKCEDQVLVALIDHSTKKPNSKWRMPLTDPQHAYKPNTAPRSAPTRGAHVVGLTTIPPFWGQCPGDRYWVLLPRSKD